MTTREVPDSGLFAGYAAFIREATAGTVPSNPAWLLYSDNVLNYAYTPGVQIERRHGTGTADPDGHDRMPDEPELSITYHLQRQLVDTNGDPDDPIGDAFERVNNRVPNTHSAFIREERTQAIPSDASDLAGARQYVIGKGLHPNGTLEMDPSESGPVQATVDYVGEKVREYDCLQPDTAKKLFVTGLDGSTELTLEDEGAATSETLTSDGETANSYSDLDAFYLASDQDPDVTIGTSDEATTPSLQSEMVTIRGANYNSNEADQPVEGDQGVPPLGTGSRASAVGNTYEYFLGSTVNRGGTNWGYDLNRMTASVENGWDPTPRHDTWRNRYNEANRNLTVESDVVGWGSHVDYNDQAMGLTAEDIVVNLSKTTLTFASAVVEDEGERAAEAEQAAAQRSVTFGPQGLTLA